MNDSNSGIVDVNKLGKGIIDLKNDGEVEIDRADTNRADKPGTSIADLAEVDRVEANKVEVDRAEVDRMNKLYIGLADLIDPAEVDRADK